jgi:hypothetical protein
MAAKAKATATAKRPAFGGYSINFKGQSDSLESVFGPTAISPAEMTKKLWTYVKRRKLSGKSR